jgi:hypothetical protein
VVLAERLDCIREGGGTLEWHTSIRRSFDWSIGLSIRLFESTGFQSGWPHLTFRKACGTEPSVDTLSKQIRNAVGALESNLMRYCRESSRGGSVSRLQIRKGNSPIISQEGGYRSVTSAAVAKWNVHLDSILRQVCRIAARVGNTFAMQMHPFCLAQSHTLYFHLNTCCSNLGVGRMYTHLICKPPKHVS